MHDSTAILTEDEIFALRKNYREDPTALQNLALRSTGALYERGRELAATLGELIYGHREPTTFVDAVDREVQLLTLFTIQREWQPLAIHCYWSILVGMHPADIAETLLLASFRAGIQEYIYALSTMSRVMRLLKTLAPREPTAAEVVGEIVKAF